MNHLNVVPCPRCSHRVNDRAPACPRCGEAVYIEHPADMLGVRHRPMYFAPPARNWLGSLVALVFGVRDPRQRTALARVVE
jgi:hypothetical protein